MILYRSVLKELFVNLIFIIFSLSVLLFMEKFVRLTRLFMGKGADFIDLLKIFIYLQPSILLLSIPMAILIAIFLTYGRMSTDSELVVFKSSGMSFFGIAGPAISLALVCSALMMFVSLYVLPRSMQSFKHTLHETIVKKASMTFEEETFSDVFKGTVIYVKDIPAKDTFTGIFIYRDNDKSIENPLAIVAEDGEITSSPEEGLMKLTMNNGMIHTFKENSSSEISFARYDFVLSSGLDTIEQNKPEEIYTTVLWQGRKEQNTWNIEVHRRLALPFACLIFGILAPALSNRIGKIGRLGGFSFSLAILILYYSLLITGEALAETEKVSAFLGAWMPNMVFGAVALIFFHKAYNDRPLRRF
ncbi:MAG: hypothetical protein AMK70_14515 [Nitrospira bacterium SG8_35_1]|nr:MAG: hypothetical protein AMK70_14515 [Nitrospira bacterium SG8_35_1]